MAAFLFDLDGTLINTKADICFSINRTLELLKLPTVSREVIFAHLGYGPGSLITSCMGPHVSDQLAARGRRLFSKVYSENLVVATRPYPGIPHALEALSAHQLAIITNKSPHLTHRTVSLLELDQWISHVWTKEPHIPHKPDPWPILDTLRHLEIPPEQAVMVGDAETDIQAGKAAGITTLGVTWGYRSPEQIAALSPDLTAHTPHEMMTLLHTFAQRFS